MFREFAGLFDRKVLGRAVGNESTAGRMDITFPLPTAEQFARLRSVAYYVLILTSTFVSIKISVKNV